MKWTHEVSSTITIGDVGMFKTTEVEIVIDRGAPVADEGDWFEIHDKRSIIRISKLSEACENIVKVREG